MAPHGYFSAVHRHFLTGDVLQAEGIPERPCREPEGSCKTGDVNAEDAVVYIGGSREILSPGRSWENGRPGLRFLWPFR